MTDTNAWHSTVAERMGVLRSEAAAAGESQQVRRNDDDQE
jgi:hypothetical protein